MSGEKRSTPMSKLPYRREPYDLPARGEDPRHKVLQ